MRESTLKLDNRLQLCGNFVRENSILADVGTDHAYLPVWLCQNRRITKAIAVDINELPLASGKKTVARYGLENCIETRLSDGLSAIKENEVDDIVIAGMGGELIAEIIQKAQWLKNPEYHLILQPMTKAELLRDYLYHNGFSIQEEQCTCADKKLYTVMSVYYTAFLPELTEIQKYCGAIHPKQSAYNYEYLIKTGKALLKKGMGMLSADPDSTEGKQQIRFSKLISDYAEKGEIL